MSGKFVVALLSGWLSGGQASAQKFGTPASQADYAAFVAELDAGRIDVEKVAAIGLPAYGTLLESIGRGSPAEAAGLQAGWVLHTVNGKQRWDHTMPLGMEDMKLPARTIEFFTPAGQRKVIDFAPTGKIGFMNSNWARPEKYVLENSPRGRWSRDLLIAMFAWEGGRPEVAETALGKATEQGMPPNVFTDYYGSLLAMHRGDHAESKELWKRVMDRFKDGELPVFFLNGVKTHAFAYHEFDELKQAVAMEAPIPGKIQPEVIDAWAKRPVDPLKSIYRQAVAHAGPDVMSTVEKVSSHWWTGWRLYDPEVLRDGVHLKVGRPNFHASTCFVPREPVKDVIWAIRFAIGNADPPFPLLSNSITFSLIDLGEKTANAGRKEIDHRQIAKVAFGQNAKGERWSGFAGGPAGGTLYNQRSIPWLDKNEVARLKAKLDAGEQSAMPADKSKIVRLALIRRGDEAEVWINGRPYLRLAVDPAVENVGCFIQMVGAAVSIDRMKLLPIRPKE